MSKLNPCPICGSSVRVWAKKIGEKNVEYIIECDNDFCGLTYGISCEYDHNSIKEAWNNVTALSTAINNDCISRKQTIDVVHKYFIDAIEKTPHEIDEDGYDVYTDMKAVNELLKHNKYISKSIKALPPITPTEKTGEWVGIVEYCKHLEKETGERYRPSGVKNTIYCNQCWSEATKKSDYCPNCGAKIIKT